MRFLFAAFVITGALSAQPLDPAKLLQPPTDNWPTYNGDYTGRRYSPLKQINASNVTTLNLAWARRFTAGGGRGGAAAVQIKATPLEVNGILYFAAPDNAWAVGASCGILTGPRRAASTSATCCTACGLPIDSTDRRTATPSTSSVSSTAPVPSVNGTSSGANRGTPMSTVTCPSSSRCG